MFNYIIFIQNDAHYWTKTENTLKIQYTSNNLTIFSYTVMAYLPALQNNTAIARNVLISDKLTLNVIMLLMTLLVISNRVFLVLPSENSLLFIF